MPYTTRGKQVVKKRTGKVVATQSSPAMAQKQAAAMNIEYARERGHNIPRPKGKKKGRRS